MTTSTDPRYEQLRRNLIWNQLTPTRYPQLVVQVASEHDVVEAVQYARANNMKIAVRGGGHSWIGFSLCNGSLLIDLGRLTHVAIDRHSRTATIQPAVTGQALNRELAAYGLAFPVGHCPKVPLSGYLLNGGLGWNSNAWGPACFSVQAAHVVTADGRLVVANEEQHADLLWAIRGAGPGFFGVVTQYLLKLYPVPSAITTSKYYYPLQCIDKVGAWTGSIARQLPREVELTIFCSSAPPALAGEGRDCNGFVGILSATAFLDTESEAAATLGLLENCPVLSQCLEKEVLQPTSLDVLLEMGGMLWPECHRCLADTVWSNSPPSQPLSTLREYFLRAPSPESLAVCVFSTGAEDCAVVHPGAAFSMIAETLLLSYAIWERPEDDVSNVAWHRETVAALDQFAVGHYVGESDIIAEPARIERSFATANWQRLQSLRREYDPDGLFHRDFSDR